MGIQTANTAKLEEMLSPHRTEFDVLKIALIEVAKEESDRKKDAAKELIRKALELQTRMDSSERMFLSEKKKFDKELGKIINRLKNMAAGRSLDEDDKDDDKESDS